MESEDHASLMNEFDQQIDAHMSNTGDDCNRHADFPPPDFRTHVAAEDYLQNELLPNAIEVP